MLSSAPLSSEQIDVSFSCVCPAIDQEFRHSIVKVAVDPRGESRVDPQTTTTTSKRRYSRAVRNILFLADLNVFWEESFKHKGNLRAIGG